MKIFILGVLLLTSSTCFADKVLKDGIFLWYLANHIERLSPEPLASGVANQRQNSVFNLINYSLRHGEEVSIENFGSFVYKVDLKNNKLLPSFIPDQALVDFLNNENDQYQVLTTSLDSHVYGEHAVEVFNALAHGLKSSKNGFDLHYFGAFSLKLDDSGRKTLKFRSYPTMKKQVRKYEKTLGKQSLK